MAVAAKKHEWKKSCPTAKPKPSKAKQSKTAQESSVVMMSREAAGERCCCCFLPSLSSLVVVVVAAAAVVSAPVASIVHSTLAYT